MELYKLFFQNTVNKLFGEKTRKRDDIKCIFCFYSIKIELKCTYEKLSVVLNRNIMMICV